MGWVVVKSKPATKILIPNNIYLIMAMIPEITELLYINRKTQWLKKKK